MSLITIFIILLMGFLIFSCNIRKDDILLLRKDFNLTSKIEVPIKSGYITTGTYNGDTIYSGNIPILIDVPLVDTRVYQGLEWHYSLPTQQRTKDYYDITTSGVYLFEDIINGDNDYNDFVCHVKTRLITGIKDINGVWYDSSIDYIQLSEQVITPIALGNILPLRFGFELLNGDTPLYEYTLFADIRKDAFRNTQGYLNTLIPFDTQNYKLYAPYWQKYNMDVQYQDLRFNYYIEVNGIKHYAANSKESLKKQDSLPYGLFIPNVTSFNYPPEKMSIYDCYPNFSKWTQGLINYPF